ncbi:MAG: hypothetical protein EBU90_12555 [Proteobacteria bacterium]|nr:hypothetical protein [Pseudomonadota bacterium]NBP15158.1 hypothetical protein [bacterium]
MPTPTSGYKSTNTFEGVLDAGVTDVFTGYARGLTQVNRITLTNPTVSVTVKLSINRVENGGNTVQLYSYTLAAGDVMVDTFGYTLGHNDTISIDNSDDGTVCVVNGEFRGYNK